ncbi:hypothetical protein HY572_01545 [Candidatus Micrarchaeota archaeon]|nr:hypothetical protein [Candidatus Micrarchaeota archaeon]
MSPPLPRIIGVEHYPWNLDEAKKVVDALPGSSRVGLEMDLPPLLHEAFQKKYPRLTGSGIYGATGFFNELAKYATKRGHTIVWLDHPTRSMAGVHPLLEKMERYLDQRAKNGEPADMLPVQMIFGFRALTQRLAPFRSKIMAHKIRRTPWAETDVALLGGFHAEDVAEALNARVEKQIGETTPQQARNARNAFEEFRSTQDVRQWVDDFLKGLKQQGT